MLAPARMPVAAGKNTAKRRKKLSIPVAPPRPRKSGGKFVTNNCPEGRKKERSLTQLLVKGEKDANQSFKKNIHKAISIESGKASYIGKKGNAYFLHTIILYLRTRSFATDWQNSCVIVLKACGPTSRTGYSLAKIDYYQKTTDM